MSLAVRQISSGYTMFRCVSRWFRGPLIASLALPLVVGCATARDALQPRYRLVINYEGLLCEGTVDAERVIEEIVSSYAAKWHTTLKPRTRYWGLEGEHSSCYALSGLQRAAQSQLISELREHHEFDCMWMEENEMCPGRDRRR